MEIKCDRCGKIIEVAENDIYTHIISFSWNKTDFKVLEEEDSDELLKYSFKLKVKLCKDCSTEIENIVKTEMQFFKNYLKNKKE